MTYVILHIKEKGKSRGGHVGKVTNEVSISWIDQSTGEIRRINTYYSDNIYIIRNRSKIKDKNWFFFFQEKNMLYELARENKLSKMAWRVLIYLLVNLDFDNYVPLTQVEIAKDLKANQGDISRALRELEKYKIIFSEKKGRSRQYRLNEDVVWKGYIKNRKSRCGFMICIMKQELAIMK